MADITNKEAIEIITRNKDGLKKAEEAGLLIIEPCLYEAFEVAIKALEQEPRTGKWIEHFDESGKWYECDQCHTDWGGAVNFCPNCGAKMAESEVEE